MSRNLLGAFGRKLDKKLRKWMMILIVVLAAAVAGLLIKNLGAKRS